MLPRLVIQMEVQQVPVINEPEKSDAAQREQRVPKLVPEPLTAVAPGFQAGVDRDQSADAGQ